MALDLIVIGILFFSAAVAFMRGFVREVLTIGSLAGAGAATLVFGPTLAPYVKDWLIDPAATEPQMLFGLVPYEMLVPVIAYACVFVVVILVLTLVTHMVSKGVHAVGLGPVDRTLGVVFGLARGVVIVGLFSLVVNFVLSDAQRDKFFGGAKTYPYVAYLGDLTGALLPGRDVLGKSAEEATKEHAKAVGQQPLEPGQAGRRQSGYSKAERKKLEALVEKPEDSRKSMQFNN